MATRKARSSYQDRKPAVDKGTYSLVILLVGAALILLCFFLPDQVTKPLRKEMLEIFGPVISTVEAPVHYFSNMDNKLTTLSEAQAQVTTLRHQLAELQVQNQLLSDREAENKRLREMLGFQAASQYELLPCRVVSRDPTSWWDTVQVNVGWSKDDDLDKKFHGKYSLTSDQPVVSPRGVVGKTGNVSRDVTDVILLVNENCSISANVDGTRDQGIVQGQGNFDQGQPQVRVKYLPKDSQATEGNFVVTSGLGPYFPAGLRLGTISQVLPLKNEYPTFGLYREAIIEPTADLNQLDELFIVLGPKQTTADETKKDDSSTPEATSPDNHP